VSNIYYMWCGM